MLLRATLFAVMLGTPVLAQETPENALPELVLEPLPPEILQAAPAIPPSSTFQLQNEPSLETDHGCIQRINQLDTQCHTKSFAMRVFKPAKPAKSCDRVDSFGRPAGCLYLLVP